MLHQQMIRPDLAVGRIRVRGRHASARGATARVGVVRGHVVLELLCVGARGRSPVGDLVDGVEVVREVFGLGVANLPVWGKTGGLFMEGEMVSLWTCDRR